MNNNPPPKSKRRLSLLEWIGFLATVIPCCFVTFGFLGVERIHDLLPADALELQPTQTQAVIEPTLPNGTVAIALTPTVTLQPQSDTFEVTGVWIGQFNDAGFNEISDYMLELSRNVDNISGIATAVSPGNPNCYSSRPVRGQVDLTTRTLILTETLGGMTTCPTFPRGSAGDIKTFTLVYDMADGIPVLRGAWQKIYPSSWDVPGEIMLYPQP